MSKLKYNTTERVPKDLRILECSQKLKDQPPRENCIVLTCSDADDDGNRECGLSMVGGTDSVGILIKALLTRPELKAEPKLIDQFVNEICIALMESGIAVTI